MDEPLLPAGFSKIGSGNEGIPRIAKNRWPSGKFWKGCPALRGIRRQTQNIEKSTAYTIRKIFLEYWIIALFASLVLTCTTSSGFHSPKATNILFELAKGSTSSKIDSVLRAGANINAYDDNGTTPLINAILYNPFPDVITTLILDGADVNLAQRGNGYTPLMNAILAAASSPSKASIVDVLIQYGADAQAMNYKGERALDLVSTSQKDTKMAKGFISFMNTSAYLTIIAATHDLRPFFSQKIIGGMNPIKVINPNDCIVFVGIRSGLKGKDFVVPSKSEAETDVPNGNYDIYFVYSNQPNALFQGDPFVLNQQKISITLENTVNGNYHTRQIK